MTTLFRHTSFYAIGNTLTTIASLVSFPILTRLLTVAEYGLMNTVTLTLTLLVAAGKLGMQRATVRFYHEAKSNDAPDSRAAFASTLVLGMVAVGLAVTLAWLASVMLLPEQIFSSVKLRELLLLTSCLVLIRVVDSAFTNLLYAEERSAIISGYGVFKRYLSLALVIAALYLVAGNAWQFFTATVVAELLALAVIAYFVISSNTIAPRQFSKDLFGRMAAFGLPMVGVEVAWSLLAVGDRYVIQHLMGEESVGIYSASYNLCEYVKLSTMVAMSTAVAPMYMRIWDQQGREATEHFLEGFSRNYLAFSFFIATVLTANARPLVAIIASPNYLEGTSIVPWVTFGMALESYVAIAAAGLFLKKKTAAIFWMIGAAAVVNMLLNYLLVPVFGLSGAAIATFITFSALLVTAVVAGRSELRIRLPFKTLVLCIIAFLASTWITTSLESRSPWLDLVVHTSISVPLFAVIMLGADSKLRENVKELIQHLTKRIAPKIRPGED